jgi:predicted transcriptional regulator of viral defense system
MKKAPKSLNDWVNGLQRVGSYTFTREKALYELAVEAGTLEKALQRLNTQGRILRLRKRFYVIVPLEYQSTGTIPAEWFIDELMKYIGKPYYVGCLSAAALYGAAHQRPQEMQVVVPDHVRMVDKEVVRIRFLRFAGMSGALTQLHRTHTGDYPVSTPEWTAIDLIRFQKHYGSMDAAASVLTELGEVLAAERLAVAAQCESRSAYLQRLGWMLDFLGFKTLTGPLQACLERRNPSYVPLNASLKQRSGIRDKRWRIVVNEQPERSL